MSAEGAIAIARAAYVVGQIALDEFEGRVERALSGADERDRLMAWGDPVRLAAELNGVRPDFAPPSWLADEFARTHRAARNASKPAVIL